LTASQKETDRIVKENAIDFNEAPRGKPRGICKRYIICRGASFDRKFIIPSG